MIVGFVLGSPPKNEIRPLRAAIAMACSCVTFAAVALYLLSLWGHDANESALRDAVADVSARRLLVHAPGFLKETIRERNDSRTLFTRRFVRDALESAAADEALVDAVARFLNDEAER